MLPRGALLGQTSVRFDLYLDGASQLMLKFVRPRPTLLAQRSDDVRALLVARLCTLRFGGVLLPSAKLGSQGEVEGIEADMSIEKGRM